MLKRCFSALLYHLSELEVYVQPPGSVTPLRNWYLQMEKVSFGRDSHFSRGLIIYKGFNISIGERASVGEHSMLHAHGKISIGNDFLAAPGLTINSGGHDVISMKPYAATVTIGDRVWCGVNVTILPGVTVGNDVVLGAGSVVNKDIPSSVVAAGNPTRIIRNIDRTQVQLWQWRQDK